MRFPFLAFLLVLVAPATVSVAAPRPSGDPGVIRVEALLETHLDDAKARTLEACAARGLELPAGFLAWIDADPVRRATVWGCRADPLPVLLGLRSLEIDLGEKTVREDYPQLALAFAIEGSFVGPRSVAPGWNDGDPSPLGDALPDISPRPPLELVISGDPRVPVDVNDPARPLDRNDRIIAFLESHPEIEVEIEVMEPAPLEYDERGIAKTRGKPVRATRTERRRPYAADVIASASLQKEFNAYLAAHGHPEVSIDCGDRVVHWRSTEAVDDRDLRARIKAAHDLFHDAYRAKGRMPAERDRPPTPSESMAWFIRNDRHEFPADIRADRGWPRFPLDAPWPVLLMLVADAQPLREREEVWRRFADAGEFRTYGEYIGGIAQQFDMQSARRLSPFPFSYGSIQMMWKDGGVCGTMGNIGARTYRICGIPASTAGQPGHCAVVLMERDAATGEFSCRGDQYATGGDEVTSVHAAWNLDERGDRRPMVFHQSVAWGVNRGLASYVETLAMARAFAALPPEARAAECTVFVEATLTLNPFAITALESAIDAAPDAATLRTVAARFEAAIAALDRPERFALLAKTMRDAIDARLAKLPA
jgi:hypothetical protein